MIGLAALKQTSYWKVTYSPRLERAHVYSSECNFACRGCPYLTGLLKVDPKPLRVEDIKGKLLELKPKAVSFLGREPTVSPDLPGMILFAKEELGAKVNVTTNGSNPLPRGVDSASISLKAYTDSIHVDYTGRSNRSVLRNFVEAYESGVRLSASSVLIPGYIDSDEIGRIAEFIAGVDPSIPYHIIGFIPFGGVPWRAPTMGEVKAAVEAARRHLRRVTWSLPNPSLRGYPSALPEPALRASVESVRVM